MTRPDFSTMLKVCLSAIAACFMVMSAATQTLAQDFVLIANASLGVSEVSASDIKQMLLGKKSTWPSGERVVFSLFNDPHTQAAFLKRFVSKTPGQFKSYWKRRVFTGKGRMPEYFETRKEVIAFVSSHPGAFSFLGAPGDGSVKTLIVQ